MGGVPAPADRGRGPSLGPKVGVIALQGAFAEHAAALDALGAHAVLVRDPGALAGVDAIVLPGGESTTMSLLLGSSGLDGALAERLGAGTPAFGTCAGLILLARDVTDGRPDQRSFGVLDVSVARNGYGRQRESFEAAGTAHLDTKPVRLEMVFIRAPRIRRVGPDVQVLAEHGGEPVMARQDRVLVATFHPELTETTTVHQYFCDLVRRSRIAA